MKMKPLKKPSVCHNVPFIGTSGAITLPSVGINLPLVGYCHFSRGFTLIELLITLVVIGIVAAISGPAFQRFVESNRLTTATNDLVVDLSVARTEALKRNGGQAVVCVSTDGASCSTSGSWKDGWIVFWDGDRSDSFNSSTDVMVKLHPPLPEGLKVTTDPTNTRLIAFNPRGTRLGDPDVEIEIENQALGTKRHVCITTSGRASAAQEGTGC